jgi:hypothetical protein
MSSSRSVAAARSRRADPPQKQNPVTSIGSHASYTGAAARISGAQPPPQYSSHQSQPQQSSYQQQQHASNPNSGYPPQIPAVEGKITVGNAIALITLRLGRLEEFMNKYHLDLANGEGNNSNGNNINTNVNNKSSGVDDSVIRNIMTRLEVIESDKQKQQHQIAVNAAQPRQPQVSSPPQPQVVVQNNDSLVNSLQDEIANVRDELRETKDLLLKLQSFTMETNQKLVDIMFQDMNSAIDIQQLEDFDDADANVDSGMNESIDISADEQMIETPPSDNINLKDIINKELANVN